MKKIFILCVSILLSFSCDNDDNGNAPNENSCTFQGATIEDLNNNTQTLIPESDLQTDYFTNNDGPGQPAVEVFDTTVPGNTFVVTRALTVGAVDSNPEIRINNVDYTGTVTCQRTGSIVGDELRFDLIINGLGEAELCVIIDNVTP